MTSEQEMKPKQKKKRWRFSLGHAMTAITVICITLAAAGAVWKMGNEVAFFTVIISGLFATIGALLDGTEGAAVMAGLGFLVVIIGFPLFELLLQVIGAFF